MTSQEAQTFLNQFENTNNNIGLFYSSESALWQEVLDSLPTSEFTLDEKTTIQELLQSNNIGSNYYIPNPMVIL